MRRNGFFKRAFFYLLLSAVLSSPALSAQPEVPADGIDDVLQTGGSANGTKGSCPAGYMDPIIGNGCDLKSPSTVDFDDDGVRTDGLLGTGGTTDIDCDDTDMRVRPGRYRPHTSWTSEVDYKLCQANGTYATTVVTATTPLCEATGSGVCYYVNCGTGNNSNAGTYAAPFLTWGKIAGGSAGSPPASPITLIPGSVVYQTGTVACATTYSNGDGARTVHAQLTQSGTALNPILIKRYPGATASNTLTNAMGFQVTDGKTNYHFEDLEFTGTCTASGGGMNTSPIYTKGSDTEVNDIYVHDWQGSSFNNDSGIYANTTNRSNFHHNFFEDWAQGTGSCENPGSGQNVQAIKLLDDEDAGVGQNHKVKFNTAWRSTPSTTYAFEGGFLFYKHGIDAEDAGVDGTQVQYNKVVNATSFLMWNSSKMRATDNITVGVDKILYAVEGAASGSSSPQEENRIEYNTFINSSNLNWGIPPYMSTMQQFTVQRNLFLDTKSSYSTGNNEGIIAVDGYGSDAQLAYVEGNVSFSSDYNCFYNPNTALVFNYFGQPAGSGGHGPAGAAGGFYTYAQWRTQGGNRYDQNSVNVNWNPDTHFRPQEATCLNVAGGAAMGKRYSAAAPVGGTGSGFKGRKSMGGIGGF